MDEKHINQDDVKKHLWTKGRKDNVPGQIFISLKGRILLLLAALLAVNLIGAVVTLWVNQRTKALHHEIMENGLAGVLAAQSLENDLVMQKGLVTYFFLNGDPSWLSNLEQYQKGFEKWLKIARKTTSHSEEGVEILNEIESKYIRYVYARDQVIQLYKNDRREEGSKLHWEVRNQFQGIQELSEKYKHIHESFIKRAQERFDRDTMILRNMAWFAVFFSVILGVIFAYVLFAGVLMPIRKIALAVNTDEPPAGSGDEIKILGKRVQNLIVDMDQAHTELEHSREQIMQSEKMVQVGRLAAGVAHSVRNPLTSVKMRLFSLERGLKLDAMEKEDFEVIAEEIGHIDTILSNFLEFARPPKLQKQLVRLSDVVDNTYQLIRHRIDSYGFQFNIVRDDRLPAIEADAEQLKEVLMNLIFNSCEAMTEAGEITITEKIITVESNEMAVMEISDSGPGIPEHMRESIFEPFFTSKAEGSGLGLSIAKRIVEEHGGFIQLTRSDSQGTAITVGLPIRS